MPHADERKQAEQVERKSLIKDCGWKDGDRGSAKEQESTERKNKTVLTLTRLLMEELKATVRLAAALRKSITQSFRE
jgi:hypothetical protein